MKKVLPRYVIKRSGELESYNNLRIEKSIFKAADFVGGDDKKRAHELAKLVDIKIRKFLVDNDKILTSKIREIVKDVLIEKYIKNVIIRN